MGIETPKANPENLLSILQDAYAGKVVIPEFQRSFVWGREDVEQLLVSILEGYFIGTFLMLDTSVDKPLFPFRAVEGLEHVNPNANPQSLSTVKIVLDGQQRISSLFYVLYEPRIPLKHAKNPTRFFLQLDSALEGKTEDAVVGISVADRRRMGEMEAARREDRAIGFPLMKDSSQFYRWLYDEQHFLSSNDQRKKIESYYQTFARFIVPVVGLSPETGKENIVNIFERINSTGVNLSLFDLAVARLYLKGVRLRESWERFAQEDSQTTSVIKPEFVLKFIAIRIGKEPKKSALLDVIDELSKDQFEADWKIATRSISTAHSRMIASEGGYGAFGSSWIPYTTMIVPLSTILNEIEVRHGGEALYRKLDRWYWASVFSNRYDNAVDTKSYRDTLDVTKWFDNGETPPWLANLTAESVDLFTDEPQSAMYRGLMCLVVLTGARDFINGQAANLMSCQDDHIFPKSKFSRYPHVNSVVNRTLISSNQVKGDKKPSEFIPLLLRNHGNDESRLLQTMKSHLISPEAYECLKRDDFEGFVKLRKQTFMEVVRRKLSN